jgi:hypothetical protein
MQWLQPTPLNLLPCAVQCVQNRVLISRVVLLLASGLSYDLWQQKQVRREASFRHAGCHVSPANQACSASKQSDMTRNEDLYSDHSGQQGSYTHTPSW